MSQKRTILNTVYLLSKVDLWKHKVQTNVKDFIFAFGHVIN